MQPWLRFLHDLSYRRSGLMKSCALLLMLGILSAGLTGFLRSFTLKQGLSGPSDSIEQIFQLFPEGLAPSNAPEGPENTPEESELFARGLYELNRGNPAGAIPLFHEENDLFPHPLVREKEIEATLRAKDRAHFEMLESLPDYAAQITASHRYRMGLQLMDWEMILRSFIPAQYQYMSPGYLLLSLIAGGIWTLLIFSLLPRPIPRITWMLIPAALALGWISTWPTILLAIVTDDILGLQEGTDFISSLLYFLASVGLREEFCKLLLFSPLLFRTVKNGRDHEALILGALVGLGFAVEENISYFSREMGLSAVSRFVSANLLHLSLTGVNALALNRACRNPGQWIAPALQIFAITVGLHAIYNTLLTQPIPGFGNMFYFSGSALAGCAYLFFNHVRELCDIRGLKISRSGVFCWGFCFLFNLELLSASLWLPFDDALYLTGNLALSSVFIAAIFLHEIREPIAP